MPPRSRRAAATTTAPDMSTTLVIGVVGTGDLTPEEVEATMGDLFQTPKIEKVEVIFALLDDALGDGAYQAFGFVADNAGDDLALSAVTYSGGNIDDVAVHEQAVEAKARIIPVGDQASVTVVDELVAAKNAGAETALVVFWVKEEDETADPGGQYAALETAYQAGIKAFNACDAMDSLDLGESAAEEQPADPEPVAEAPAEAPADPPRRGRPRKTAPADDSPEESTAAVAEEAPPRRRRSSKAEEPTLDTAADEAQTEALASYSPNGDLFHTFAKLVAAEITKLLTEGAEAAVPARRKS